MQYNPASLFGWIPVLPATFCSYAVGHRLGRHFLRLAAFGESCDLGGCPQKHLFPPPPPSQSPPEARPTPAPSLHFVLAVISQVGKASTKTKSRQRSEDIADGRGCLLHVHLNATGSGPRCKLCRSASKAEKNTSLSAAALA